MTKVTYKLRLGYLAVGSTYLDSLPRIPRDIDSHNRLLEVRVGRPDYVVVDVLLVEAGVEPLEEELKERDEILGVRRGDVDVHVAEHHGASHGQPQAS
jgi:hypothetical protein